MVVQNLQVPSVGLRLNMREENYGLQVAVETAEELGLVFQLDVGRL